MRTMLHFLTYNNAVPIALGVLFLGAGGLFAATNPDSIYFSEETVIAIDNTYLANKDLNSFTPQVRITEVTEDDVHYYVAYDFETIDLEDYVWRDVVKREVMKVSKEDLGPYRDLGLYVMGQLQQKVEREIAYLKEAQELERRQISNKTVATSYSGLVGALLNDSVETLPGYAPVVVLPRVVNTDSQVASASGSATASSGGSSGGPGAPIIQILGNNPAWIPLNSRYADLGAVVTDDKDANIGIHVFFGGKEVTSVSLDTNAITEYEITYQATDTDGNVGQAKRTVVVYDPATQTPPPVTSQTPPPQTSSPSSAGTNTNTDSNTNTGADVTNDTAITELESGNEDTEAPQNNSSETEETPTDTENEDNSNAGSATTTVSNTESTDESGNVSDNNEAGTTPETEENTGTTSPSG